LLLGNCYCLYQWMYKEECQLLLKYPKSGQSLATSALTMDGSGVLCKCSSNLCSILQGGVMLITVVPLWMLA
jgi:hypothetical protein